MPRIDEIRFCSNLSKTLEEGTREGAKAGREMKIQKYRDFGDLSNGTKIEFAECGYYEGKTIGKRRYKEKEYTAYRVLDETGRELTIHHDDIIKIIK